MIAGTRTVYAELQRKEFENLHINGLQKAYLCIDSLGRRAQILRFSGSVGIPVQTKRMIDQRELAVTVFVTLSVNDMSQQSLRIRGKMAENGVFVGCFRRRSHTRPGRRPQRTRTAPGHQVYGAPGF
jgi:hypothetical protein